MMRRFASRGSRVAVYLADTLLVALVPAMFFYPAYYGLVPQQPKQNLLPLELMNPKEQAEAVAAAEAYQEGIWQVAVGTLTLFFLAFILYQTFALLTRLPDGTRRGQTFGMKAVSTRVVKLSDQPISFINALLRGVLFSLSVALFFASILVSVNLLYFLVSPEAGLSSGVEDHVVLPLLLGALGVIALHFIALIPRRSPIDRMSGTCQVALYGDLIEKEHKK